MKTKEELIAIYNKGPRSVVDYHINNFVRDYNENIVKHHVPGQNDLKFTDYFKCLEAMLKYVDDKYNYTDIINKHKEKLAQNK